MPNEYDTPFGQFYRSLLYGEAVQLARKAGTSGQYLWSIASGRRKPGVQICARLMAADERITLAMLRPDHFEELEEKELEDDEWFSFDETGANDGP